MAAYGRFALFKDAYDMDVDGTRVTVPPGNYILQATDQGFVHLHVFDDEDSARASFAGADEAYGEWLDFNE